MVTTGSKFFFGAALLALVALVIYGGASEWEALGVVLLSTVAAAGVLLGSLVSAFRDADARTAVLVASSSADAEGHAPAGPAVSPSLWPLVSAVALGVAVVGLVTDQVIFLAGVFGVGIALVEWMVRAWADRATANAGANDELRGGLLHPVEYPVAALAGGALVVLPFSRMMLALQPDGASVVFIAIGAVILAIAVVLTVPRRLSGGLVATVLAVGGVGIVAGGIASAAIGERTFHHAEEEGEATRSVSNNAQRAHEVRLRSDGSLSLTAFTVPKGLTFTLIFENDTHDEVGLEVETGASQSVSTRLLGGPDARQSLTLELTASGTYAFRVVGEGPGATGTITVP